MKKLLLALFIAFSSIGYSQVTQNEAEEFMKERCKEINMEYLDSGSMKWDEETTVYVFLSKKGNYYCVSSILQYSLKVLTSDCGGIEKGKEFYSLVKKTSTP